MIRYQNCHPPRWRSKAWYEARARELLARHEAGERPADLAKEFDLHPQRVYAILRRARLVRASREGNG
jgi:Mor family transcriptional regulator